MKRILLTSFLIFAFFGCNAQFKKEKKGKIRIYKIAFLTERLDLTENEAEKFWPIYNIYDKKMMELRKEERMGIRKKIKEAGGLDELSENEAKKIIEKIKAISEERYRVKANFYNKINTILSYKKLLKLEVSEHEFDKKLLRKFRHGRKKKQ